MAVRNCLSVSKLDDFKNWLISDGYKIVDTKGYYEVLRAIKTGRKNPLIVYKRLSTDNGNKLVHLTILDKDMGVVRAYLRDRRVDNELCKKNEAKK